MTAERADLREHGGHVVVGTPGRIHDMMKKGFFKTDYLRLFVMDEADEMLSVGFKKDLDLEQCVICGDTKTILLYRHIKRIVEDFKI